MLYECKIRLESIEKLLIQILAELKRRPMVPIDD